MAYQVLARKWRPPTFADVVGQQLVTRTLVNAIRSGRVAHAFLFSGVRGVGKTTTARILAKALNCHEGVTPEPCGQCVSCQEIAASSSVDVLEIDAASNTGVDNIREIRESVRYGTARDRFKIFIIDEVHMLSTAAFNALLKTLEEPPPHVKFILATTELNKIPVTITSRCQQFDFKPIPFSLLLERLRLICKEEGVQITEYGLRAVAGSARGSMRDAQSALDQIISLSGQNVSDEDIRTLLGVVDEKALLALVDAVQSRDSSALLEQMRELAESGADPQNFCRKFLAHVRNLMVCRVAGWNEQLLHLPDSDKEALLAQAQRFSELDLIRFYDLLSRAENELRFHPHPFVHLEMALMKLVELAGLPTLEQALERLQPGRPAPAAASAKAAAPAAPAKAAVPPPPAPRRPAPEPRRAAPAPSRSEPPPATAPAAEDDAKRAAEPAPSSEREVVDYLQNVLQEEHASIAASLQYASSLEFGDGRLNIVFPPTEKVHFALLDTPACRQILSEACARITGSQPEVTIRASGDSAPREEAPDPLTDPQVKMFYDAFPGKYRIDPED